MTELSYNDIPVIISDAVDKLTLVPRDFFIVNYVATGDDLVRAAIEYRMNQ